MVGIKKLGCLGVLSRKTSKNPQKDESYQEGFRTDPISRDLTIGNRNDGRVRARQLVFFSLTVFSLSLSHAIHTSKTHQACGAVNEKVVFLLVSFYSWTSNIGDQKSRQLQEPPQNPPILFAKFLVQLYS